MIELEGDATPERHWRSGPSAPMMFDSAGTIAVSDACRCGWSRSWLTEDGETAADALAAANGGWCRHVADL